MPKQLSERRLFFREFLRNFHATGAILPSGRQLARALARYAGEAEGPKRVLEVGPGTGAVTRHIVAALGPEDRLDLVELNESFARRLSERFGNEAAFQTVAGRVRVLHTAIEELSREESYDVIVSGLPLNNFSVETVRGILESFAELLAPGGTLSFFEYIAIRRARSLVSVGAQRARLRGIDRALRAVLEGHEIHREAVWLNVPPAWVHHVRFD